MRPKCYIYSVTANPLHEQHIEIFQYLKEKAEKKDIVCFEISEGNATKNNIPSAQTRAEQLDSLCLPYIITNGTTFASKAFLIRNNAIKFRSVTTKHITYEHDIEFAVGADCYQQIFDVKHYCNSYSLMKESFETLLSLYCGFLVFRRNGIGLDDISGIPDELYKISRKATNFFSKNISSTQLRRKIGF